MAFEGVERLALDDKGALVLSTKDGQLVQHPPVVYQDDGGRREVVPAHYLLEGNQVRFALGAYDPARPLVIDPVLAYSTLPGRDLQPDRRGDAVDAAGNAHVVGITTSPDFPRANAFDNTLGGDFDGFVTKLNASGSALLYSTYLGGTGFDEASAVAVDTSGSAYAVGTTGSLDFPVLSAFDSTFNGNEDVFVTKLGPSGALAYSTYLGGSLLASGGNGDDIGKGIGVDGSGNAYVTGYTFSTTSPWSTPSRRPGPGSTSLPSSPS